MKKLHIALLILSFLCGSLIAQENLKDGYIITNTNDTIYGKIDLRTSSINQTRCLFSSEEIEEKTFYPGDIKGYRYINPSKYYISKEITIGEDKLSIFAEFLVQGGLSLYYFTNKQQAYFLFEEDGKEPFYITQSSPKKIESKLLTDYKYKGVLQYYFQDGSPNLSKVIEKAKFDQRSMIAIAKQYNDENCLNPEENSCTIFENKTPDSFEVQAKFSIYTGIQNTAYDGIPYKGKGQSVPLIGGQVYIFNPRWSKSAGVILDLSFSKMKDQSSKTYVEYTDRFSQTTYDIYTLSGKIGLRYTFSKFRLKPSIEGGGTYTNIIKNNSYHHDPYMEIYNYDVRKNHLGGYIGVGVDYNIRKTQSVFLRFNHDFFLNGDRSQKQPLDNIKVWQIKIGYTF